MNVPTRLKRLAAGALGLFALAAGGLLAAPYFISEHEARLAAVRALHAATGVEPRIAGPVTLSLLPSAAVRIEDVRLGEGEQPAFAAAALRASIRLLPLLYGRIEVSSLTLEQARLFIDLAAREGPLAGLPVRADAAPPGAGRTEVRFVDATVLFRAEDGSRVETLHSADLALARSGAALTATGSFIWRALPGTISLSVGDTAALAGGGRSGIRLRLETEPLRASFDGGVAYRNGLQADGALSADARSLRALFAHLPGPVRPTRGGFGPFKLKAQAALAANTLALSGLSLELDGNRAEGGVSVKHADGRTVVQATLASESADFTPYSGGFAMTAADGRDWSRDPIDLSVLDAFDLDVRLSSGRVVVRKTELARVAATATLRNGRFTLAVGEAQFHGGTVRGNATFGHGAGGEPAFRIEANLSDFDLATGLAALADMQRLEGKGTLSLAVESTGRHMRALTQNLAGTVTLSVARGALAGINVEQALRRLERNPLSGAPDFVGGRTAFDRLNAKLRIEEGTARIEEAAVESPQLRVQLAGETSVVRRNLDLRGTAALVRTASAERGGPFELPFLVLGSWERPFVLPDPTALIQRSGAAAPLLDAARRREPTSDDPAAGSIAPAR